MPVCASSKEQGTLNSRGMQQPPSRRPLLTTLHALHLQLICNEQSWGAPKPSSRQGLTDNKDVHG
jgi:hypothetical protein